MTYNNVRETHSQGSVCCVGVVTLETSLSLVYVSAMPRYISVISG